MAAITAVLLRRAAETLGIRERASPNEIRPHYKERIKEWHPDVSQKDQVVSHEMTIRVKDAYDLLVDSCMDLYFPARTVSSQSKV